MKGFTLIEIIISLAVFMMVVTIITGSIFFTSDVYERSQSFLELSQNGRVVLDSASREIRQAQKIITPLPDEEESFNEIKFQDGHLDDIFEEGVIEGGEGRYLEISEGSEVDNLYKDSYIKITSGPQEVQGETRKIVSYDGETQTVELDFPISTDNYFGLDYLIDTSYYYVRYWLEEDSVKREVSTFYFSDEQNSYVSINSVPPEGQELKKEVLESRTIGTNFERLSFWEDEGINITVELEEGGRGITLFKKVVGRNI